jgi:SAM-dependent methyltransferase
VSRPVPLAFDPAREEEDLKAYLGERYERATLERYDELLGEEMARVGDEATLYRTSQAYLYNLTAFAMTATKLPYLDALTSRVPPGARVLDYGCGIGSDGLLLLEAGYRVEFADFDNPSTAYLRWRLERRGLEATVHDLDGEVPAGFDAAYAFDVIEHVRDPWALLDAMERRADLVMLNLLEYDANEQELHYELPIPELLDHVARRRLERYDVLFDTSHLVIYRPQPAGTLGRLRSRSELAAGRLRFRRAAAATRRARVA